MGRYIGGEGLVSYVPTVAAITWENLQIQSMKLLAKNGCPWNKDWWLLFHETKAKCMTDNYSSSYYYYERVFDG